MVLLNGPQRCEKHTLNVYVFPCMSGSFGYSQMKCGSDVQLRVITTGSLPVYLNDLAKREGNAAIVPKSIVKPSVAMP